MKSKRGFLAVVMALAMVFAGAVFVADEVDATDADVLEISTSEELLEAIEGQEEEGAPSKWVFTGAEYDLSSIIETGMVITQEGLTIEGSSASAKALIYGGCASVVGQYETITISADNVTLKNLSIMANIAYYTTYYENGLAIYQTSGIEKTTIQNVDILKNIKADTTGMDTEIDVHPYAGCIFLSGTSATLNDVNSYGGYITVEEGTEVEYDDVYIYVDNSICGVINEHQGNDAEGEVKFVLTSDYNSSWLITEELKDYVICLNGNTLTVPEDSTLTATVEATDGSEAVFDGLTSSGGDITISEGSIVVSSDVEITGTSITVKSGTFKLNESTGSGLTIVVDEGATLVVPEDVSVAGAVTNNGTVNLAGTIDGAVTNNGTVAFMSEDAKINGATDGTGTIDTSASSAEGVIGGDYDTTTTFSENQVIEAVSDVVLKKNTVFTFKGTLVIPEGVTVTVQPGAQLIMAGQAANLVNEGTIIVESTDSASMSPGLYGGLVINGGVTVNKGSIELVYESEDDPATAMHILTGTFTNEGTVDVSEQSILRAVADITNDGTITVGSEAAVRLAKVVNKGTFTSEGTINACGVIENQGDVTLAGKTRANITIDIASVDATMDIDGIVSYGQKTITVTEDGLATSLTTAGKVVKPGLDSQITITVGDQDSVSGLGIVAVTKVVSNEYYIVLEMSGNVVADDETEGSTTTPYAVGITTFGDVSISGDLVLNGIDLTVGGTFTVPGTLSVINDKNNKPAAAATGTVTLSATSETTITGTVSTTEVDVTKTTGAKFNAVAYTVKATTSTPVTYYYTTLANAVASGTEKATVYGTADIEADLTVPGTMTIEYTTGALIVVDSDATMTLAAGAVLKVTDGDVVDVDGTLVIEDVKKSKVKDAQVDSEVKSAGENTAKYTSLVNALDTAVTGDVIKLRDAAFITADVAIAEGVTLQTETYALTVNKGRTLTIDGTLYVNGGSLVVLKKEADTEKDGAIVLNNLIQSDAQIKADGNFPAGAYYSVTEKTSTLYCVMPVTKAAGIVNDVDDSTLTLDGKLEIADVAFTGTADKKATIVVDDEIAFGTITLDMAKIAFTADKVSGSVSNGAGTVAIVGTAGTDFAFEAKTTEGVSTLTMSGAFTITDDEKEKVTATGDVAVSVFTVCCMTVDGTVTVTGDSSVTEMLTVNGTVNVANDKTLALGDALVLGTLSAAEKTDAGEGTITVNGLFVGIEEEAVTGASATVSGKVNLEEIAFVSAGSTVPESITDLEEYTEYYVDGELWVTAYYVDGGYSINTVKAPVENAYFEYWAADGADVGANDIGSSKKVDAKIDYNIYDVTIYAGEGIGSIAIDGVVMMNPLGNIHMMEDLAAGEHEVTYTLKNGYEGTAKLYMDGKEVSSMVLSGVNADRTNVQFTYTLSGATAVVDQPVVIEPAEDEGLGLTDILLIVLVVLIVIMAVIVALRMMRS